MLGTSQAQTLTQMKIAAILLTRNANRLALSALIGQIEMANQSAENKVTKLTEFGFIAAAVLGHVVAHHQCDQIGRFIRLWASF